MRAPCLQQARAPAAVQRSMSALRVVKSCASDCPSGSALCSLVRPPGACLAELLWLLIARWQAQQNRASGVWRACLPSLPEPGPCLPAEPQTPPALLRAPAACSQRAATAKIARSCLPLLTSLILPGGLPAGCPLAGAAELLHHSNEPGADGKCHACEPPAALLLPVQGLRSQHSL